MEKLRPDRSGEVFQDEFTENETKPRGSVREDAEDGLELDSDVDSQAGDRAMAENRFGVNEKKNSR